MQTKILTVSFLLSLTLAVQFLCLALRSFYLSSMNQALTHVDNITAGGGETAVNISTLYKTKD